MYMEGDKKSKLYRVSLYVQIGLIAEEIHQVFPIWILFSIVHAPVAPQGDL